MNTLRSNLRHLPEIIRNTSLPGILQLCFRNLAAVETTYLLRYNLARSQQIPIVKLGGGEVELMDTASFNMLCDQLSDLAETERRELLQRIRFFRSGFKNCYILKENGTIASLQWLIYPNENDLLMQHCKGRYLPLKADQVYLERVYTLPQYRGRGFQPFVTAAVLRTARDAGYKQALMQIRIKNIVALNSSLAMGFRIIRIFKECKLLGYAWLKQ